MRLAKTAVIVFVVRVAGAVLQLLGLAYFAHVLGAALLGSFVLFQALTKMLTIAVDLGIGGAVEKRVSEGTSRNVIGTAIAIKAGLLVGLTPVVFLFRGWINSYLGSQIAIYLLPVLLLDQLGKTLLKTLRGELRVDEATLIQFVQRGIFVIVGAVLIFLGHGVLGLVVATLLGWSVSIVWTGYAISSEVGLPSMAAARSIFDYSKYNYVSSVLGSHAYSWLDTVVIGLFLTQSHVAAYEVAWRITGAVTLLSGSISTTIFPQVSEWDAGDDTDAIERIIPNALSGSLVLVVPAVFGVLLFSEEILRLIFGAKFAIASAAFLVLMLGKVPESINGVVSRILLGMNRPDLVARAVFMFVVMNVILNIALVSALGLVGAAIATTLSFSIMQLLTVYYLKTFIDVTVAWLDLEIFLLAGLAMAGLLLIIRYVVDINSLSGLATVIVIGAFSYFILLMGSEQNRGRVATLIRSLS